MDMHYLPLLLLIMLPPMAVIVGLAWLALRALKAVAPKLSRSWRIAIGGLVPVLPFWCGYLWNNGHPVILFRDPDGSVALDEGWLIITQLLFAVGSVGLVIAFPAAIFFTRRARPERRR